jgi:hypothetical protein
MGKMKELYMDEMEQLEEVYRAEKLAESLRHENDDSEVEVAQEKRRLENRVEEAQSEEDQISGQRGQSECPTV